MRSTLLVALAVLALAVPASAELQNVEVGGHLRITGNWYSPEATGTVNPSFGIFNFGNPIGAFFVEEGHSLGFVEQWTRLNVTADFTNDVSAFIELDSYDIWGEDFRGGTITGVDGRQASVDDVEIYQAYIEAREMWGMPLMMRVGRQEIMLGSEWLVGNNDTASFHRGLSFDGLTLRYDFEDMGSITAFATKLADNSPIEQDGDIDFYGIYGSYTGLEDITIDAYWMYLRDGRGSRLGFPFDTANAGLFGRIGNSIEGVFGVDQYDETQQIHTFGLRGAGTYGAFDFEGEFAYQTGDAPNTVRAFFSPDPNSLLTGPALPFGGPYGDDGAEYDAFGANLEVGYTFDITWQPRVYLGAAWFEGEDNREDTFREWLRNLFPFYEQDASISFNRLFSDWEYSEFLANTDLSNALIFRGGVSAQPTENIEVLLALSYFQADETFVSNGVLGVPFWGYESDDEIGFEAGLYLTYTYSEDLAFNFGYAHFFAGDGVDNNNGVFRNLFPRVGGNFLPGNGLFRLGGISDDDADYFFAQTSITF